MALLFRNQEVPSAARAVLFDAALVHGAPVVPEVCPVPLPRGMHAISVSCMPYSVVNPDSIC